MNRFQIQGVSDERDFCECCGKKNLKRVVFVLDTESGDIKHFGTTCVLSPAKGFDLKDELKRAIGAFEGEQAVRAAKTRIEYKRAGGAYVGTAATGWTVADRALWDRCYQAAA
jgi:hypothetical protein